jgi:hypothetical protein
MRGNVMILKTKREKTFFVQSTIYNLCCIKQNLYPMFIVYMYMNIDMLKSKYYTR